MAHLWYQERIRTSGDEDLTAFVAHEVEGEKEQGQSVCCQRKRCMRYAGGVLLNLKSYARGRRRGMRQEEKTTVRACGHGERRQPKGFHQRVLTIAATDVVHDLTNVFFGFHLRSFSHSALLCRSGGASVVDWGHWTEHGGEG